MSTNRDQRSPSPEEASAIERTAAQWVLRAAEGLRPEERSELERWLAADPWHQEVFDEMRETSSLLDQLREPASAGLPAGGSIIAFPSRGWQWAVASLAAAALVALVWLGARRDRGEVRPFTESAVTAVGELRTLNLPDGSTVQLNTATAVSYRYSASERRVILERGEAHFTVASDVRRPFLVFADGVRVRAVGTAFGVRRRTEGVEVLVTHGKVQVEHGGEAARVGPESGSSQVPTPPVVLVAGQRLRVATATAEPPSLPTAVERVETGEMERLLAWQSHRLEFAAVPLADAVTEFNRYNRHRLIIADPALGQRRFGGSFSAQGYEAFVELLVQNFGVVAERRGDTTVLREGGRP